MSNLWINGFVVAQSEKAVGIVPCERDSFKPAQNKILWVPVSKIADSDEGLVADRAFQIDGEKIERRGTPKSFCVDLAFLAKVNAEQFGFC
jgi:hypothetical protein